MVCFATEYPECPTHLITEHVWNLLDKRQVLIYRSEQETVGLVVMFDAGHRILFLDNLIANSKGVAVRLIEHAMKYAKAQGIDELYFTSGSEGLKRFAEAHDGTIFNNVTYTAFVPVR